MPKIPGDLAAMARRVPDDVYRERSIGRRWCLRFAFHRADDWGVLLHVAFWPPGGAIGLGPLYASLHADDWGGCGPLPSGCFEAESGEDR